MAQITTGIRSILSEPKIYNFFQDIIGSDALRREYVEKYLKPKRNHRVLDIGCGTARILGYFPDVDYVGFDLSEKYISYAQKRYGDKGTFYCALVEEHHVETLGNFNLVMANGILHHLDDSQADALLGLAFSVLKKGGRLVTKDPCFSDDQHRLARFLVSRDRGENVRELDQYLSLVEGKFDKVTSHLVHKSGIPYTHCIMELEK